MRFEFPQLLSFVPVAIAFLGLLQIWAFRRRRVLLGRFAVPALARQLTRGVCAARRNGKFVLVLGAVVLIFLALARPKYGTIERPLRRRGVEVLIAIDCSLSMLGRDIQPNRLARALEQMKELIRRLEGDKVGVIAFAGVPVVQCPITADYAMALNLLDSIDVETVPVRGTAIARTIRKARETFQTAGKGYKVLVLLTDGEDHEEDPVAAAREAAEAGIRIYAVGIGSTEGVPILLPGGGYKESADGRKVNTRLDFDTLREIAFATGGKAIHANPSGSLEMKEIYRDIASLKEMEFETTSQVLYRERFQYFLAAAILLLCCELLFSDRSRRTEALSSAPQQ